MIQMDLEFSNLDELKRRVMPAINIRLKQLKKENLNLSSEQLWNYFVSIWKNCHNLTLADLVDDVLNKEIFHDEDLL